MYKISNKKSSEIGKGLEWENKGLGVMAAQERHTLWNPPCDGRIWEKKREVVDFLDIAV